VTKTMPFHVIISLLRNIFDSDRNAFVAAQNSKSVGMILKQAVNKLTN